MEVADQKKADINQKNATETLFSYLDKGIDDMEAGKVRMADEAFHIIRDRMKDEL